MHTSRRPVHVIGLAVHLAVALLTTGCGAVNSDVSSATTTAVDAATSPAAEKRYSDIAVSVVGAARDKVLDADTTRESKALVSALGSELRAQLLTTRNALLDKTLQTEVSGLRTSLLGAETKRLLRELLDEVLGPTTQLELGTLREELVGAPLRASTDALVDEVVARLTSKVDASVAQAKADAATEVTKYKTVAIAVTAAAVVLLGALGVAVHLVRSHQALLRTVLDRLERQGRG